MELPGWTLEKIRQGVLADPAAVILNFEDDAGGGRFVT